MNTLDEPSHYILGHSSETVLLVRKVDGETWVLGEHYGDPTCGLIGPEQTWFLSGGEGLLFFDFARGSTAFMRDNDLHVRRLAGLDRAGAN